MPNATDKQPIGGQLKDSFSEGVASLGRSLKQGIINLACLLALVGVPAAFIWMLLPDSVTQPIRYATEYNVDESHVFIEKEPTDCDWGHAPIGNKACHYDKGVLTTKNANGLVTDVYVGWNKVPE